MRLQEGVDLHFIKKNPFKTNQLKIRFTGLMREADIAGRVLATNILESACQDLPTPRELKMRLAELYGATLSTNIFQKGAAHIVDITISYVDREYLPEKEDLTQRVLVLLKSLLFHPLADKEGFSREIFDIEKKNLLAFLESEKEDNFYHAELELNRLFFEEPALKIPKVATVSLVEKETPQSTFQVFKNMMRLDKVDIFAVGDLDEKIVLESLREFPFLYRKPCLMLDNVQSFSNVVREKMERKNMHQSILGLAYHLQVVYNDVNYISLLVLNGLLGEFSHSALFVHTREEEGLAYTIGSRVDIFSNQLAIFAGVDRENRSKLFQSVIKEILKIKKGQFTEEQLETTKKMMIQELVAVKENPAYLIEQIENHSLFNLEISDIEESLKKLTTVSKKDVIRVAQFVRLQSVYFMEGTR